MTRTLDHPNVIMKTLLLTTLLLGVLAGCSDSPASPDDDPTFTVEVSGEQFKVTVENEADAAGLRARMASGAQGVITGKLVRGNGGFNTPWNWHLDPKTVKAVDLSIELCDGRPSMVEEDLDEWMHVGAFCPWGAKVVAVSD